MAHAEKRMNAGFLIHLHFDLGSSLYTKGVSRYMFKQLALVVWEGSQEFGVLRESHYFIITASNYDILNGAVKQWF